ncbi:MAG: type II toxin-antitoxin system VapC family toxin [Candidatus Sigynarchaeota archaeon]
MDVYLDTNILVSFFHDKDLFHKPAAALIGQSAISFVTGLITLIEFEAVIGRLWASKQLSVEKKVEDLIKNLPLPYQIKAIVEFCFMKVPVRIIPEMALETFDFNGERYTVDNTFNLAFKICPEFRLKTLDTMHVASAVKIKNYRGINIQYLVTTDDSILNEANGIHAISNILPISSADLCKLHKIPF